jgi:hypothetical protein
MTRDALTAALLARDPLLSDEEAERDAAAYHETTAGPASHAGPAAPRPATDRLHVFPKNHTATAIPITAATSRVSR